MAREEKRISEQPKGMGRGLLLSVLFHGAVVLAALVGLPFLTSAPDEPDEFVMVVNPVVDDVTAAPPPAPRQAEEVQPPPAPEPVVEPEREPEPAPEPPEPVPEPEPEPEPAPEPTPAPVPEPPAPEPEPEPEPAVSKPEPTPAPEPETPREVAVAEPAPPEPEPAPAPPPKPAPTPQAKPEPPGKPEEVAKAEPKQEPKPQAEPVKKDEPKEEAEPDPFDSLLKTVEAFEKKNRASPEDTQVVEPRGSRDSQEATSNQVAAADRFAQQATASEKDAIKYHVSNHWSPDTGVKGLTEMWVEIDVVVRPDGSVVSATIGSDPIPGLERAWRAFAESARRAVQIASPLPIPAGKYETFRNMTLIFRPEDAIW